ncbi:hypothetical protein CCMA1212_004885 [Trichoderma ghanense]|uniref:Uncharacterized protein n=1 Tax=Trichoderma ghanense TaxID=65468 RepID=A0ABY2H4W0_9HYPO
MASKTENDLKNRALQPPIDTAQWIASGAEVWAKNIRAPLTQSSPNREVLSWSFDRNKANSAEQKARKARVQTDGPMMSRRPVQSIKRLSDSIPAARRPTQKLSATSRTAEEARHEHGSAVHRFRAAVGLSKLTPMPDFITSPPPASAMCQARAVNSVWFGPQRPGASTVKPMRGPGKRRPLAVGDAWQLCTKD